MHRALLAACAAALCVTVTPLAALAQPQTKVWRIGVLETISPALNTANLEGFRLGLRELGYVEGQNVVLEYRSADGRQDRFAPLAGELVRMKPDVIVTRGTPASLAAKAASRTIPIVMTGAGDPVGTGIVASLSRPGGNVTGLSAFNIEMNPKRIQILRELIPRLERVAGLFNMGNPLLPLQWKELEQSAASLGVGLQLLDARRAEDLDRAFDNATVKRADALFVALDAMVQANRARIVELAAKHRLPAIYASEEFVEAGGLISYAPSFPDLYYRAATYVDRILKGTRPADLPVAQPTKFEMVVNLKAAQELGIVVPQSILLRADRVIQ